MEPPSGGDAISHVCEFVGSIDLDKVFEDCRFDKVRMKLSYAIDLVASDGCKESHSHHLWLGFFDYRNTPEHVAVLGEALLYHLKELRVDLVNDLEMSWEQVLHHGDRPFFQSLRHYRVVCVAEGFLDNVPGFSPFKSLQIDQNTLQLDDSECRMSVV